MSAVDTAWEKHRRDIEGRQRPNYSDREAGFRAGWAAAMRYRDAQGEQAGLPLGENPRGPAWTPSSGRCDETRETSLEAAASMAGPKADEVRTMVLNAIRAYPDTDQGLARRLEIPENTVRPRRGELVSRGLVAPLQHPSGKPARQKTESGRSAQVWAVTDRARRGLPVV